MSRIYQLAQRGEYAEFGIKDWNDLLLFVFKEANVKPSKYDVENGLELAIMAIQEYLEKAGLERALKELRDYKEKFGKEPASNAKGIVSIYNALRRGVWNDFGITSWSDLKDRAFSRRQSP